MSGQYTTPLGFSSLFAFCGLPLRLDAYKGFAFRCSYCFARARESAGGTPQVRPADPQKLARMMRRVFIDKREDLSVVSECLKRRMPLHFGGMGDPFQPVERRFEVALSYLRAISEFRYPVMISTRGSLVASSPYLELLRDLDAVVVQFSLSTSVDKLSTLVERPEVAPSIVLKTMETLSRAGVQVTCRWQPFIPGVSEDPKIFVASAANTGAQHCSFEVLRLPRERNRVLIDGYRQLTGGDIYEDYLSAGAKHRVREYILPPEMRLPKILEARAAIHGAGMLFGSADNDFQYLSDTACCCSGADAFEGFENFFRHQIGYAVHGSSGARIEFSSIREEWTPQGSIDRYLNSARGIAKRFDCRGTAADHIRHRWNRSSGLEGAPDSFYGVKATGETSDDGMAIFEWDAEHLKTLKSHGVFQ